jgi:hypothetical protein
MAAPGTSVVRFPRTARSGCDPFGNGSGDSLHALLCAFGQIIDSVLCDWCNLASLIASNSPLETKAAEYKADEQQGHPGEGAPKVTGRPEAAKGCKEAYSNLRQLRQKRGSQEF